jgi:hypothetical protein
LAPGTRPVAGMPARDDQARELAGRSSSTATVRHAVGPWRIASATTL